MLSRTLLRPFLLLISVTLLLPFDPFIYKTHCFGKSVWLSRQRIVVPVRANAVQYMPTHDPTCDRLRLPRLIPRTIRVVEGTASPFQPRSQWFAGQILVRNLERQYEIHTASVPVIQRRLLGFRRQAVHAFVRPGTARFRNLAPFVRSALEADQGGYKLLDAGCRGCGACTAFRIPNVALLPSVEQHGRASGHETTNEHTDQCKDCLHNAATQ